MPNTLAQDQQESYWQDWRWQVQHAVHSLAQWEQYAPDRFLISNNPQRLKEVVRHYPLAVTPYYLSLIQPHNPEDPLLKQVFPGEGELTTADDEREDPIGDLVAHGGELSPPTIVHRYPDRVLFLPTLRCPLYCRFCFRRSRVGQPGTGLTRADWEQGLRYVERHPGIREVILSGGEPLLLDDALLQEILERLSAVPQVQLLRIHTRMLAVNPFRFTPDFLEMLKRSGLTVWIVAHFNHPQELGEATQRALATLAEAGFPVLSQTVLLKGVNDDPMVLEELLLALIRNRVRPYYLHHLDPAPGTMVWRVSVERGRELMRSLQGRIPGYAWPRYVREEPGGKGKVLLYPAPVQESW